MKEGSVRQTVIINKPAHEVFDFTINPENTPKWVDGVVREQTNESPTKLGTVYRNQGHDGSWSEFEITAFEADSMFEMTKKGDNTHVQYTFMPVDNSHCELEYCVWVDAGEIDERFSKENIKDILQKLKNVIEENNEGKSIGL